MIKRMFRVMPKLFRVKQWIKNFLVLIPFLAAGKEMTWFNLKLLFLGFMSFCLTSSIIYMINDWNDKEADRLHETKSKRPIASREVSAKFVILSCISLFTVLINLLIHLNLAFISVIFVYASNSLLYTFYLKKIPILEFISVSIGFILRGYAGATIFSINLSSWFLIVIWFSSLYLILGKREAEFRKSLPRHHVRQVLNDYTLDFLKDSKLVSLSAAVTSYCSWALFEKTDNLYTLLSVIPVTAFFLTYSIQLEKSKGESPEVIMLENRLILLCLGAILVLLYLSATFV